MEPLKGAGIVVTRPAERSASLCRRISAAGGKVLAFPTLRIEALPEITAGTDAETVDWMVFTSVPAVEHGWDAVSAWRNAGTGIAAIGDATAASLEAQGVDTVLRPATSQDSEGLLATPEFTAIDGARLMIIKGVGGRGLLAESLSERGATVTTVDVYRRRESGQDPAPLLRWWRNGEVDAIVVSSGAGLQALHDMLDAEGRKFLAGSRLVAPTARMLKLAQELGIEPEPIIADGASDEAVVEALQAWWTARANPGQEPK